MVSLSQMKKLEPLAGDSLKSESPKWMRKNQLELAAACLAHDRNHHLRQQSAFCVRVASVTISFNYGIATHQVRISGKHTEWAATPSSCSGQPEASVSFALAGS